MYNVECTKKSDTCVNTAARITTVCSAVVFRYDDKSTTEPAKCAYTHPHPHCMPKNKYPHLLSKLEFWNLTWQ